MTDDQVKAVIAEETGVPIGELTDERRLDSLSWDSLVTLNMMYAVEKQCGVSVRDEQLEGLQTVGDMCRVVRELQASHA